MANTVIDPFFSVYFFDGKTAIKRKVEIQTIGKNFFLLEQERRHGPYSFEYMHFSSKRKNALSYSYEDIDGWRLTLAGPIPKDLIAQLPPERTYGSWIDKLGLGKASLAFIMASAAAIAIIFTAPQWLAPIIPQSLENRLGDALVGDFGGRICHTEQGKAALSKLTNSLDANPDDLQVEVVNINMLNAIALPGGKVFLFEGLIQQAKSVDEVAGVLGHEIGHVRERHVMQSLLRQLGLSFILGGLNENVGGVFSSALSSSYGRDAEREADSHSIKMLDNANISPIATKGFFDKLSKMTNEEEGVTTVTSYMSSHPLSSERAAKFEASFDKERDYQPALTSAEWAAIQSMCSDDEDVESGFGFDFNNE